MADLEKKLCELLHELPQKRGDFEELQRRYNAELLSKRELKTELENLRTEGLNVQTQLELTNKALHKCEESYSSARESAVKNQLSFEAATKTIDVMKEQATKLHMENVKLKKQVEDLERDMRAETFLRESCVSKQSKTQTAITSLTVQMRNLEKDFRDMERQANEAISIGNKSKLMLEHKDTTIAQLKTRTEELSGQLVSITSENRSLQERLKEKKPVEQHYVKEILQEWQSSVNEMKTRASSHEIESEMLHQTLQNALNAQSKFQSLEAAANERVSELEKKLLALNKSEKKNRTDCSVQTDLNISIDVACQTVQVEMETLSTQTELEAHSGVFKYFQNHRPETTTQEENKKHEQSDRKHVYSNLITSSNMITNSSISDFMSRLQENKEMQRSHQLTEFSELATQINNNMTNT